MKKFSIFLFLAVIVSLNSGLAFGQSWFNDDWIYRRSVTVNNAARPSDLTDYSVKVTLNAANFDFSLPLPHGEDLRLTDADGITPLPFWIQSYDPVAANATLWVKVPLISGGSQHMVYLYWGNPSAQSASNGINTFSAFSDFDQNFKINAPAFPDTFSRVVIDPSSPTPMITRGTFGSYDHFGYYELGNVLIDSTDSDPSRRYKCVYTVWCDSLQGTTTALNNCKMAISFSPDGRTWTKQPFISQSHPQQRPWIVKFNGTYFLYFESRMTDSTNDRVGLYTSPDAVNWTFYDDVVHEDSTGLRPWMNVYVSHPSVWLENGVFYLFFEACGGQTGKQEGLATSTDGYHFTIYGTTPVLPHGSTGSWDDEQVIADCEIRYNGQYWLTYHGSHHGSTQWAAGFAYSPDLIHWTKWAPSSNRPADAPGSTLLFWDQDGSLFGIENWTDAQGFNNIVRTNLVKRDSTQWPFGNQWTFAQKGSPYGLATDTAGVLNLSGDAFVRSSSNIVSTQTFTDGFEIEMRNKYRYFGSGPAYGSVAIGSGDIVDMNTGGTSQWETTVLQSGYAWFISASGVLVRMPAAGGKSVLNSWSPNFAALQNFQVQRMIYDDTDSLKWYVGDTLRTVFRDATFRTGNKRVLISQGEHPTGTGGEQFLDWVFVRKYVNHEPTTQVGTLETHTYVELISPNGGEVWQASQTASITWSSRIGQQLLRVELNRNYPAGTWEILGDNVPNTGTYAVTVGGMQSDHCRVRLSTVSDTVSDISDADFAIAPRIHIQSPAGGEHWVPGEAHPIVWSAAGLNGLLRVELNRTYPNGVWELIADSVTATGTVTAQITAPPSDSCRVRISEIGTAYFALSDSNFTIGGEAIHLLSPNGGEQWQVGVPQTVQWNSQSVPAPIRLSLNRNYPDGTWEILADSLTNTGQASVEVSGPISDHCRVQVSPVGDTLADISDGDFRIIPDVRVISPHGGEQWLLHETGVVQWFAVGWTGLIRIELNRNYPLGDWSIAADSLPNTGTGYVNAGDSISSSCRIRISTIGAPFSAMSDSNFSISSSQGYLVMVRPRQPMTPVTSWNVGTIECPRVPTDTFLLRNLGNADVNVYSTPEPSSGMFEQRSTCGDMTTVPPGQMSACEMVLSFGLPDMDGTYQDTLLIPTDASNQQGGFVRIPLAGHRIATPAAPQHLTIGTNGNDVILNWSPATTSTGGCALANVQYRIYAGNAFNDSLSLIGQTSDTTFVIAGGISQAKVFYSVSTHTDATFFANQRPITPQAPLTPQRRRS